ncbi:MAG: LLM class flavin-dependent oxidoreductase [Chloroflexota bacterium]
MQIGIGLPNTPPGATGGLMVEWARRSESAGFSTLGTIGRIVYDNYEELISLAAAAGATQRIGLMTTVLVAPPRNEVMLAKQAATLDAISGGRFTLGIGVGGREDDARATGAEFRNRGARMERQIQTMRRIWSGEKLGDGVGAIGPKPVTENGPLLVLGGNTPRAMERAARLGDGFISTPNTPDAIKEQFQQVEKAWRDAGKSGKPYFAGGMYFALGGDETVQKGRDYARHYYTFAGEQVQEIVAGSVLPDADTIKGTIRALEDAGMDEVIMWPTVADINQVDLLAAVVR